MTPFDRAARALDRAMTKLAAPCIFRDRNTSDRIVDPSTGDASVPAMPGDMGAFVIVSQVSTRATDGTIIGRSTVGIMPARAGFAPAIGDRVIVGDIEYRITGQPITHYVEGKALSYRLTLQAGGR